MVKVKQFTKKVKGYLLEQVKPSKGFHSVQHSHGRRFVINIGGTTHAVLRVGAGRVRGITPGIFFWKFI